ncbi:Uncharacterised protein [Rodentibacter pneumotropicus]|uniref:Uncharacterized protein n=1 Tax=Rodentibacter pneumotropicus TaxID=758 RepID=A0A3S4U7J4_9PAST|nr:Uncharacterised protein [Rodentibacter pneumotropicus]
MKLREVFRGEWLYIPRCQTALRVLRNYHFKADYDHLTQTKKHRGVWQCWNSALNIRFLIVKAGRF